LKNYERLEARIRGLKMPQAGKVSMVATVGLAAGPLPEIMARLIEANPRVRIRIRNDGGSTTVTPVISGEVDIGLGFNIPATPGIRTLANFDIPIGVVLPPGHRLASEERINLADVVQEPLVLAQPGTSLREAINLTLAPLPIPVEPLLETNSTEMLKHLVMHGTALTLLNPLDVLPESRRGALIYRPLSDPYVRHQPMKLFTRARAPLDAATSLFVEFLLSELAEMVREVQGRTPSATIIDQDAGGGE
jgi:DNA-binding transcriptional LysR family regulator